MENKSKQTHNESTWTDDQCRLGLTMALSEI